MIPKTIHYCWFGGNPKNGLILKCILSWKTYLPEYEIIEWNETNVDIEGNEYLKFCYENKQWAYVADYARLLALREHGGIYLDTDMEVIKPFPDNFLYFDFFAGQEINNIVSCGIIGAIKNNIIINDLIEYYNNLVILEPIPVLLNDILIKQNKLKDSKYFLPKPEVFYPMDYNKKLTITENSYTIHHWEGSWKDDKNWFYETFFNYRADILTDGEKILLKNILINDKPIKKELIKISEKIQQLKKKSFNSFFIYNLEQELIRYSKKYIHNVFFYPERFNLKIFIESLFNPYLKKKSFIFYLKLFIKSILFKKTNS